MGQDELTRFDKSGNKKRKKRRNYGSSIAKQGQQNHGKKKNRVLSKVTVTRGGMNRRNNRNIY